MRSIFKRSAAGLNSEFSFSLTGRFTKVKEISLPFYSPLEQMDLCLSQG